MVYSYVVITSWVSIFLLSIGTICYIFSIGLINRSMLITLIRILLLYLGLLAFVNQERYIIEEHMPPYVICLCMCILKLLRSSSSIYSG